jgi:hypothetical protein
MKKPLFNTIERQIIRANDSLFAMRALLHIAFYRLEKEFCKEAKRIANKLS